ncbi:MAG: hypothetical protein K2M39_05340 [Muribaculaceae bacterium]|nr:hypothetical protein [Muribaculaceae bacterium]
MKKFMVAYVALAAALASCSNKGAEKSSDSDTAELDSMVEMVGEVADTVMQEQDQAVIISSVREIYQMVPEKCYTPEFEKIIEAADAKAEKDGSEVGYFDYDILTNSQDPGELKDVEIVELIAPDSAKVKVSGNGYGEKGYVMITVKLVDDSYFVDDVEGFDGKSVKQAAQAYVNEK